MCAVFTACTVRLGHKNHISKKRKTEERVSDRCNKDSPVVGTGILDHLYPNVEAQGDSRNGQKRQNSLHNNDLGQMAFPG
jgi:hypothetical protein